LDTALNTCLVKGSVKNAVGIVALVADAALDPVCLGAIGAALAVFFLVLAVDWGVFWGWGW
jgi:hypothetical protein